MRAKYCKCKNTYTIKNCKDKKCKTPYYWSQGIGSIHADDHNSTITNIDTTKTYTRTATEKDVNIGGDITNY